MGMKGIDMVWYIFFRHSGESAVTAIKKLNATFASNDNVPYSAMKIAA
jgi:hypothetical protein